MERERWRQWGAGGKGITKLALYPRRWGAGGKGRDQRCRVCRLWPTRTLARTHARASDHAHARIHTHTHTQLLKEQSLQAVAEAQDD